MLRSVMFFLLLLLISCSGSPLATGQISEQNRIDLMQLKVGMSTLDVQRIMGTPYKVENKEVENINYQIWYYITKATFLGQSELLDENFTPVIFQDNKLMGWGRYYYEYVMNINNAKEKALEKEKEKYIKKKSEENSSIEQILEQTPNAPEATSPQQPATPAPQQSIAPQPIAPQPVVPQPPENNNNSDVW